MNEEWSTICEGTVITEYADFLQGSYETSRLGPGFSALLASLDSATMHCKEIILSSLFYRNLAIYGFEFGPTFRPLERIRYNDEGEAVASIRLSGWTDKIACGLIQQHVIHPTALDGIFQLGMAAISNGSWTAIPTMLPTQLRNLWISYDLLELTAGNHEIEVYTEPTFRGYREADFSIVARDAHRKVQIFAEGWRETALSTVNGPLDGSRMKCYHVEWLVCLCVNLYSFFHFLALSFYLLGLANYSINKLLSQNSYCDVKQSLLYTVLMCKCIKETRLGVTGR